MVPRRYLPGGTCVVSGTTSSGTPRESHTWREGATTSANHGPLDTYEGYGALVCAIVPVSHRFLSGCIRCFTAPSCWSQTACARLPSPSYTPRAWNSLTFCAYSRSSSHGHASQKFLREGVPAMTKMASNSHSPEETATRAPFTATRTPNPKVPPCHAPHDPQRTTVLPDGAHAPAAHPMPPPEVLLEPDLQVERRDLVPRRHQQPQRQATVHAAAQQHGHAQRPPQSSALGAPLLAARGGAPHRLAPGAGTERQRAAGGCVWSIRG